MIEVEYLENVAIRKRQHSNYNVCIRLYHDQISNLI